MGGNRSKSQRPRHGDQQRSRWHSRTWLAAVLFVAIVTYYCASTSHDEVVPPSAVEIEKICAAGDVSLHGLVFRGSAADGYRLFTTRPIKESETLFHIPRRLCVTEEDIQRSAVGSALSSHSSALLERVGPAVQRLVSFSLFLILERRNVLSPFQPWFRAMPPFGVWSGALWWDEEVVNCVDGAARHEYNAMQSALHGCYEAIQLLCRAVDDLCGVEPSFDDVRWALTLYFHFNIQDQAIIPLITFARFGSPPNAVTVVMNRTTGGLNVRSSLPIASNSEVFFSFPRGPRILLTSRGEFDPFALGVEAVPDLQSAVGDQYGQKYCLNKAHELMFGSDGKPRQALLSCYAWLIATPQQRKQFSRHLFDTQLMDRVKEDLRNVLEQAVNDIPETCHAKGPVRDIIDQYTAFTRDVLSRNLATLSA